MTRSIILLSGLLLLLPFVLLANTHAVAQVEHKPTCVPAKSNARPADFLYYHGLVSMHAPLPVTENEMTPCPQTKRVRT